MIIILAKQPFLSRQPSLGDSVRLAYPMHELDHVAFTSLLFLQSKVVSLASNPQPGGLCLYTYAPSDTGSQLYPQPSTTLRAAVEVL
jgi:hypothetical protein